MSAPQPPTGASPAEAAQRAADELALALEDVGFDVGRAFPLLQGDVDGDEAPTVELGKVGAETASGLAAVLSEAARRGVVLPGAWRYRGRPLHRDGRDHIYPDIEF